MTISDETTVILRRGGSIVIHRRFLVASILMAVIACSKESRTLERVEGSAAEFDLVYQLPASPLGIASDGHELMVASRSDPWGVVRIRRDGDDLEAKHILLIEPRYEQKMQIDTLTWNGSHYVGYTTASWFERSDKRVFTLHDRNTMQVIEHRPAPDHLGCLAWDGATYWAATRRNTRDSPEPAHLYRLDRDFKIIATMDTPGVGCQGLAWDGKYLWFADVFGDAIHVIDVAGGTMRVVHTAHVDLSYLSGVVAFEKEIWITDYDKNRLSRIRPERRVAWTRSGTRTTAPEPVLASVTMTPQVNQTRILHASHRNSFARRAPDHTELIEWSVELRDGALWGSWKIWFGEQLFERHEQASSIITIPQFARYEVTVYQPNAERVEQTFEARAGENEKTGVRLADATAAGDYRVNLFLHAQFVTRDGQGRVLNNSAGSLHVRN